MSTYNCVKNENERGMEEAETWSYMATYRKQSEIPDRKGELCRKRMPTRKLQ